MRKSLDYNFWHACAGGMIQIPPVQSKVFYFPQGHAEHSASSNINFNNFPRIPPYILCELSAINFMADEQTDEVYAKMKLTPLKNQHDFDSVDEPEPSFGFDQNLNRNHEIPLSFTKTLTQSDANNGGGFSVPRYCAETILPALDYTRDPPVQTILAKDVHGKIWKFRHIYRGTPRRHLLTTGWSGFVNNKNLLAGDLIVFLRGEDGCLRVGIRRAKRGFCGVVKDDRLVMKAVSLGVNGEPFEVFYYPRAGTPEFCVTGSSVAGAMRVKWCSGMRFKMAFETEDCCRISWFMGTVCSVNVGDQNQWIDSPWRMLQVLVVCYLKVCTGRFKSILGLNRKFRLRLVSVFGFTMFM